MVILLPGGRKEMVGGRLERQSAFPRDGQSGGLRLHRGGPPPRRRALCFHLQHEQQPSGRGPGGYRA